MVVERANGLLCGWPICCNPLQKQPQQKYRISRRELKVYDASEGIKYCSDECMLASELFKNDLSDEPVTGRHFRLDASHRELVVSQGDGHPQQGKVREKKTVLDMETEKSSRRAATGKSTSDATVKKDSKQKKSVRFQDEGTMKLKPQEYSLVLENTDRSFVIKERTNVKAPSSKFAPSGANFVEGYEVGKVSQDCRARMKKEFQVYAKAPAIPINGVATSDQITFTEDRISEGEEEVITAETKGVNTIVTDPSILEDSSAITNNNANTTLEGQPNAIAVPEKVESTTATTTSSPSVSVTAPIESPEKMQEDVSLAKQSDYVDFTYRVLNQRDGHKLHANTLIKSSNLKRSGWKKRFEKEKSPSSQGVPTVKQNVSPSQPLRQQEKSPPRESAKERQGDNDAPVPLSKDPIQKKVSPDTLRKVGEEMQRRWSPFVYILNELMHWTSDHTIAWVTLVFPFCSRSGGLSVHVAHLFEIRLFITMTRLQVRHRDCGKHLVDKSENDDEDEEGSEQDPTDTSVALQSVLLKRQEALMTILMRHLPLLYDRLAIDKNLHRDLHTIVSTFNLTQPIPSFTARQWYLVTLVLLKVIWIRARNAPKQCQTQPLAFPNDDDQPMVQLLDLWGFNRDHLQAGVNVMMLID